MSALDVCTWCLGDLRAVPGVPAIKICDYCGRAVSFDAEPVTAEPLLLPLATPADPRASRPSTIRAA